MPFEGKWILFLERNVSVNDSTRFDRQPTNWDHSPKIHATLQQRLHNAIRTILELQMSRILNLEERKKNIKRDVRLWERTKIVTINISNLNRDSLSVIFLGQVPGRVNRRTGNLQSEKNNPSTITTEPSQSLDTETVHERLTINVRLLKTQFKKQSHRKFQMNYEIYRTLTFIILFRQLKLFHARIQ